LENLAKRGVLQELETSGLAQHEQPGAGTSLNHPLFREDSASILSRKASEALVRPPAGAGKTTGEPESRNSRQACSSTGAGKLPDEQETPRKRPESAIIRDTASPAAPGISNPKRLKTPAGPLDLS